MKERLEYSIAKLRRQIKNGGIKKETCEILVAQIETYIDFMEMFNEDMELAEFNQAMDHRQTIVKINDVLKDFGMIWKQ